MTLIKAPNGDVYDLDATVASGLLGSAGSGWEKVDDPADETPRPQGAKVPGPGRGAAPADIRKPAEDGTLEEWQAYADHINLDRAELDKDGTIAAVAAREAGSSNSSTAAPAGDVVKPEWPKGSQDDWAAYAGHLGLSIGGLDRSGIRNAIEAHEAAKH